MVSPFGCFVDGIDFFYASKSDARKLVDFLLSVVPCKCVGVGCGCECECVDVGGWGVGGCGVESYYTGHHQT